MNFPSIAHAHVRRQPLFKLENLEDRRLLSVPFLGTPFTINQQSKPRTLTLVLGGGSGLSRHHPRQHRAAWHCSKESDIAATHRHRRRFSVVDTAPGDGWPTP